MECYSELEIIRNKLDEAAEQGVSLLTELRQQLCSIESDSASMYTACEELFERYIAIDIQLRDFLSDISQIELDREFENHVYELHECNEVMQHLMLFMESAYILYSEHGDFGAMRAFQEAFCKHYPNVVSKTRTLTETIRELLQKSARAEMSCVYAAPEIMISMGRANCAAPYPFNHADDEDELYMEEVYGAPYITGKINTGSQNNEIYIEPDATVRFCPYCDRPIPASSLCCPYCGLSLLV